MKMMMNFQNLPNSLIISFIDKNKLVYYLSIFFFKLNSASLDFDNYLDLPNCDKLAHIMHFCN